MNELKLNIDDHLTSIRIGIDLIDDLANFTDKNLVLLVDENVYDLHPDKFEAYGGVVIPSGEEQKSLLFVEDVIRQLVDLEIDRSSFLVGVGGGLVSDIAGFVASIYMRGIPYGFVSTTLLGQVDASIGGKNGVNLDGYKNMIGIIRQPEFVWCDLALLKTLPKKELSSGFAEIVKYGAIKDADLFSFLQENYQDVLDLKQSAIEDVVTTSVGIKVDIVQKDVLEKGDRKLLNFGHTLGHSIEKQSGILHGEAVSIGMVLAARLSVQLGFLSSEEANKVENLLSASGLPVETKISKKELFDSLLKDKKRSGDKIHLILLRGIGEAFIHSMELTDLKTEINDLY